MPRATRLSDGNLTLLAANDETAPFTLMGSDPGRQDTGQIQIDAGAGAGGGQAVLRMDVKVDNDAAWVAEPTAINIAAGTSQLVRLPKYAKARVVVVSTSDATMPLSVFYR